jgi:hypothetical protein
LQGHDFIPFLSSGAEVPVAVSELDDV